MISFLSLYTHRFMCFAHRVWRICFICLCLVELIKFVHAFGYNPLCLDFLSVHRLSLDFIAIEWAKRYTVLFTAVLVWIVNCYVSIHIPYECLI